MKMNLLKLSLTLISAAGVASCGGNGGQPLTATSIPTVIGQLKTSVLGSLPTSNTVPTMPIAGATTNSGAKIKAADCETSTPNPTTDADGDNIAKTKTSTFNCTSQTFGTYVQTRQGTYTVTDKDDTKAGVTGGLRIDYAITKYNYLDNSDGSEYENSYNGYWDYTGDGSGGLVSKSNFAGYTYYKSPSYSFASDYTYDYTWNWTQTPTDINSPWTAGKISFDGTFSMEGTFDKEDGHGAHTAYTGSYSLKHKSSSLTYDVTCAKFWKSGSIFVDDYNGNILEIRYACSTADLYVNGTKSTLVTF